VTFVAVRWTSTGHRHWKEGRSREISAPPFFMLVRTAAAAVVRARGTARRQPTGWRSSSMTPIPSGTSSGRFVGHEGEPLTFFLRPQLRPARGARRPPCASPGHPPVAGSAPAVPPPRLAAAFDLLPEVGGATSTRSLLGRADAAEGNRDVSPPTSAMITWAAYTSTGLQRWVGHHVLLPMPGCAGLEPGHRGRVIQVDKTLLQHLAPGMPARLSGTGGPVRGTSTA